MRRSSDTTRRSPVERESRLYRRGGRGNAGGICMNSVTQGSEAMAGVALKRKIDPGARASAVPGEPKNKDPPWGAGRVRSQTARIGWGVGGLRTVRSLIICRRQMPQGSNAVRNNFRGDGSSLWNLVLSRDFNDMTFDGWVPQGSIGDRAFVVRFFFGEPASWPGPTARRRNGAPSLRPVRLIASIEPGPATGLPPSAGHHAQHRAP